MINDVHLWSFMYHYYEMTYIHNHSYNFAGEAQCVSPATGLLAGRWGHPRCSTGLGFFTSGQNSRGGIAMLKYLKVLGNPCVNMYIALSKFSIMVWRKPIRRKRKWEQSSCSSTVAHCFLIPSANSSVFFSPDISWCLAFANDLPNEFQTQPPLRHFYRGSCRLLCRPGDAFAGSTTPSDMCCLTVTSWRSWKCSTVAEVNSEVLKYS